MAGSWGRGARPGARRGRISQHLSFWRKRKALFLGRRAPRTELLMARLARRRGQNLGEKPLALCTGRSRRLGSPRAGGATFFGWGSKENAEEVGNVGQRFDACRRVVLHSVVCETGARVDGGYLSAWDSDSMCSENQRRAGRSPPLPRRCSCRQAAGGGKIPFTKGSRAGKR